MGKIFRHKTRKTVYELLCKDAFLEKDMTVMAIYEDTHSGQVWVRPASEFFDGRFEEEN